MRTFLAILAFLSLTPLVHGQPLKEKTPEQLLPADCVAYFRYDGYAPHRKAYDQTALAKSMKEGLGGFLEYGFSQLLLLTEDLALADPKKYEGRRKVTDRFLNYLWSHGFAASAELVASTKEQAGPEELLQLTIVFPQGAQKQNREAVENNLRLVAGEFGVNEQEVKHNGRAARSIVLGEFQANWWPEGEHLVLTIGAQPMEKAIRVIDGRRPNLTSAKWFADLTGFKRYETDMRGYVDLQKLIERAANFGLEERGLANFKDRFTRNALLAHLGLTGLKDLSFHLGFEGKYQRSTVKLGVVEPAQRTGLLQLLAGPAVFDPVKLPPLPPDADYVSVRHLDWENAFDYTRRTYGLFAASKLFSGELPERFPDVDRELGIDFRKDFLAHLDTTLVSWGAHSEGPFFLGQGFAVKVKDAGKIKKGLQAINKALKDEAMFAPEKKIYRGHEMTIFSKSPLPLTYTLHNDWLVVGLFPQAVQGYLMRRGGAYRTWKLPAESAFAFAKERKETAASKTIFASVSDPRPAVEIGLALMPIYFQFGVLGRGTKLLDVGEVPNSQSINEWLFPNTTLAYDDGNALRWEHHYSMNEPDDFLLSQALPSVVSSLGLSLPRFPALPEKALPADPAEEKKPVLCPATAEEKDGTIRIIVKETRMFPSMVTHKKAVMVTEKVVVKGETKEISKTVYVPYQETIVMNKEASTSLIPDGKKVQVTRRDGKPVDPKTLPMLLKEVTQVVLVRGDMPDAAFLEKLDERTLIIRVVP